MLGFNSTSPDIAVQNTFTGSKGNRVMYHIIMKKYYLKSLFNISAYPTEQEFLMPPFVEFVTKSIRWPVQPSDGKEAEVGGFYFA